MSLSSGLTRTGVESSPQMLRSPKPVQTSIGSSPGVVISRESAQKRLSFSPGMVLSPGPIMTGTGSSPNILLSPDTIQTGRSSTSRIVMSPKPIPTSTDCSPIMVMSPGKAKTGTKYSSLIALSPGQQTQAGIRYCPRMVLSPGQAQTSTGCSPRIVLSPGPIKTGTGCSPRMVLSPGPIKTGTGCSPRIVLSPGPIQTGTGCSPRMVLSPGPIKTGTGCSPRMVLSPGPIKTGTGCSTRMVLSPGPIQTGTGCSPRMVLSPGPIKTGTGCSSSVVLSPRPIQITTDCSSRMVLSPGQAMTGARYYPSIVSSPGQAKTIINCSTGVLLSPGPIQTGTGSSPRVVLSPGPIQTSTAYRPGMVMSPGLAHTGTDCSPGMVLSPEEALTGTQYSPRMALSPGPIQTYPKVIMSPGQNRAKTGSKSGMVLSPESVKTGTGSSPRITVVSSRQSPGKIWTGTGFSPSMSLFPAKSMYTVIKSFPETQDLSSQSYGCSRPEQVLVDQGQDILTKTIPDVLHMTSSRNIIEGPTCEVSGHKKSLAVSEGSSSKTDGVSDPQSVKSDKSILNTPQSITKQQSIVNMEMDNLKPQFVDVSSTGSQQTALKHVTHASGIVLPIINMSKRQDEQGVGKLQTGSASSPKTLSPKQATGQSSHVLLMKKTGKNKYIILSPTKSVMSKVAQSVDKQLPPGKFRFPAVKTNLGATILSQTSCTLEDANASPPKVTTEVIKNKGKAEVSIIEKKKGKNVKKQKKAPMSNKNKIPRKKKHGDNSGEKKRRGKVKNNPIQPEKKSAKLFEVKNSSRKRKRKSTSAVESSTKKVDETDEVKISLLKPCQKYCKAVLIIHTPKEVVQHKISTFPIFFTGGQFGTQDNICEGDHHVYILTNEDDQILGLMSQAFNCGQYLVSAKKLISSSDAAFADCNHQYDHLKPEQRLLLHEAVLSPYYYSLTSPMKGHRVLVISQYQDDPFDLTKDAPNGEVSKVMNDIVDAWDSPGSITLVPCTDPMFDVMKTMLMHRTDDNKKQKFKLRIKFFDSRREKRQKICDEK